MSGHNQITTVDDLLKKMRMGVDEVHEIHLRDLTIPVRVLSIDEVNTIRKDSIKAAMLENGDNTDVDVRTQRSTLKLATTIHAGGAPLLSDKLMQKLTVDEMNYLYNEYIKVMDSVNPSLETMTPEQFKELVAALKEKKILSSDLSLPQLREICTAFVDLLLRLEQQNSQRAN